MTKRGHTLHYLVLKPKHHRNPDLHVKAHLTYSKTYFIMHRFMYNAHFFFILHLQCLLMHFQLCVILHSEQYMNGIILPALIK